MIYTHEALRKLIAEAPGELSSLVEGAPKIESIVHALALWERKQTIIFVHPRWVQKERDQLLEDLRDIGFRSGEAGPPAPRGDPDSNLKDVAAVFYTSGSTGRPKAVLHTRRSIEASCKSVNRRLEATANDRWLCALPIAHVGGFAVVMRAWLTKAELIAGTEKDLPEATIASLVPTMLHRLLDAGFEREKAPELRAILLGGASTSSGLLARAKRRGLNAITTYGMTETFGGVALDGLAIDEVELRIDEHGTIEVRGPMLMRGYAGAPPLDQHQFFDTEDLGRFDENQRLTVLSRRTEMIISGGENVYPAEVETALEQHAYVDRACVFGVPDEEWGHVVCAVIVPAEGAPPDPAVLGADLRAHLSRVLAPFKRPRRFAITRALPETPQGKLDRAKARKEHAGVFEVDSHAPALDTA